MSAKGNRQTLVKWIWQIESRLDTVVRTLRDRIDPIEEVRIQAYRGFGNRTRAELRARLMEDRQIRPHRERASAWDNVRSMVKQIATREIPDVTVSAEFAGQRQERASDEEGYVEFRFETLRMGDHPEPWQPARLSTVEAVAESDPARVDAEVLIPPAGARFCVVSDVDDTIIRTGATSVFQKTRVTLLRNAHSRVPFEGVAAFYRALQSGTEAEAFNPIFYLSSSPWNLYDLLSQFIEVHGLPKGPLLLRDLGIERDYLFKSSHGTHKRAHIELLLDTYPELPFILVGDSGQKDPEIYRAVAQDFPERILAIYVRDVTNPQRDREVRRIASEVTERGVDMLLVPDTLGAAEHAAENGWIPVSAVDAVHTQREKDQHVEL